MKQENLTQLSRPRGRAFLLSLLLIAAGPTLAGPGAHGPGGEHLDAPAATVAASAPPRLEAHTELFELVGHLYDSELSLLIDRYESNEPLLDAQVEVESGNIKAVAKFHADHGDYAVDDERLLALLRQPGAHALVFTIVKGQESDLMNGTLVHAESAAVDDEHDHAASTGVWLALGLLVPAALLTIYFWRRKRAVLVPGLGGRA